MPEEVRVWREHRQVRARRREPEMREDEETDLSELEEAFKMALAELGVTTQSKWEQTLTLLG
jgi:hypothetical protein